MAMSTINVSSISQIHSDLLGIEADVASISRGAAFFPGDPHAIAQSGVSFSQVIGDVVRDVDAKERAASAKAEAVETGRSDDLVGAMLASQEAGLSFSMLMQVRNKVMGALDEVIKLQL